MPRSGHPVVSESDMQTVSILVEMYQNCAIRELATDIGLALSTLYRIRKICYTI
ncbi:hypothetical protein C0J52_03969 [Blattella germanica]|nr:hypothetical protein C0J52_03969 [Blattella germanica]